MSKTVATRTKKLFVELPHWKVVSRPVDQRSEVTVYVKGFLAEGDTPENFDDWLHSHKLLVLSPKHRWGSAALGYSWPSGSSLHHIPVPLASVGSAAYLIGRNFQELKHLRMPSPLSMIGAVAIDVGLHLGRLAYQFNVATKESQERAEMLAWRLLELRRKHDYLRVVGHSLGCRHIVEACGLMQQNERPNSIHLCAPALVKEDILPWIENGTGGLGKEQTLIYYSHKDITLGILLRILLGGTQAVGEIGLLDSSLDPTVTLIDASKSLGGYYIGAHTDYANKFHYFCYPGVPLSPTVLES
ncbi:uncharacterized protein BX664DRAFT_361093 [Halteromyces radiatus]|uniref:uncharacterized protein n=1 Tax=Halteromyces radiatus TaxID=101107 RepID=UPI00221FDF0B|nr:uncharacterized protein BX664DRAFT_361093 [Halteromyces radiatus]KAI8082796.1 hypothetical protein BX664DRAFT_361093 [Halteromyces radiatus]